MLRKTIFSMLIAGMVLALPALVVLASAPPSPSSASLAQNDDCGIDLMLVLDSSGSISPYDFDIMKQFVVDLVNSFEMGEDAANIGVIQFSTNANLEIGLSNNQAEVVDSIQTMIKYSGSTNITDGIRIANDQLTNGRGDVPRVIIVLTDGMHNEGPSPEPLARQLRIGENNTRPVTILGVAVGDIRISELIAISGGDDNVIQVPDFAGLQLIRSILYDYSCAVATGVRTTDSSSLPTAEPRATNVASTAPQSTAVPPPTVQAQSTAIAAGPTPTIFAPSHLGDTTQIAFSSDRDGDAEIFVMNGDGTNVRQLTFNEVDDDKPAWSPDGTKIAFESSLDGDYEIYVMDSDGANIAKLTDNNAEDWGAAWSPDGSQIAFHSTLDGDIEIYVMSANGRDTRQLTVNNIATDRSPEWSPDGSKLVYFSDVSGGREIYVVDVASGDVSRLTSDEYYDGHPDWSGSSLIAFSSTRVNANAEIYVMNSDGSNLRRITNYLGTDEDPTWSPDSSQIAFESTQSGNYDIWVINADGTGLVQLTNDPARDWSAAWAWKPGQN